MKRLLLLAPTLIVAACGSSHGPTTSSTEPMVYAKSAIPARQIASCLEDRLSRVHETTVGSSTELTIGSSSSPSYIVTLTPASGGAVIKVTRPADASDDPPEPELRYAVARCTT
jgi:hypothetical protein